MFTAQGDIRQVLRDIQMFQHRVLGLVVQEGLVILLLDLVPVGLVQVPLDSVPVGVAPNSVVLVDQGFMARVGS